VIGTGTPGSCRPGALRRAVRAGGRIVFDCGPNPVTIQLPRTLKVLNTNRKTIIDGGGLVTLSGAGQRRILYQNTCDAQQVWTTSHCQDQRWPLLVVRRITLADGNSTGEQAEGGGGGAIFVRGGQLRLKKVTFTGNRCDRTGPDLGGAAVRVLSHWSQRPVRVRSSRFLGGVCANGGGVSSIGVSWRISRSYFAANRAVGRGANPARPGTPGGGSGGAIYLDGNSFRLVLRHTVIEDNWAREGGGAIFFVSNDRTGTARLSASTLRRNTSAGFETPGLPGIFFLGARPPALVNGTVITR
ncbi:MAG: hypothetical protein WAW88_04155, partial [Nocardioides sp.]